MLNRRKQFLGYVLKALVPSILFLPAILAGLAEDQLSPESQRALFLLEQQTSIRQEKIFVAIERLEKKLIIAPSIEKEQNLRQIKLKAAYLTKLCTYAKVKTYNQMVEAIEGCRLGETKVLRMLDNYVNN